MELETKMDLEEKLEAACAEIHASLVDGGGLAAPLDAPARALVDAAHGRIRRDVRNTPAFLAVVDELLATRDVSGVRAATHKAWLIYGSAAEGPPQPPPAPEDMDEEVENRPVACPFVCLGCEQQCTLGTVEAHVRECRLGPLRFGGDAPIADTASDEAVIDRARRPPVVASALDMEGQVHARAAASARRARS